MQKRTKATLAFSSDLSFGVVEPDTFEFLDCEFFYEAPMFLWGLTQPAGLDDNIGFDCRSKQRQEIEETRNVLWDQNYGQEFFVYLTKVLHCVSWTAT